MRILVLFALIGLSVAVPVYEVSGNYDMCHICKVTFDALLKLVKAGATQHAIDLSIRKLCPPILVIHPICKMALNKVVSYLKEHLDKADADTVCKAIHACKKGVRTLILLNW
ncbi:unnamed protein product [Calicophoron daubneyi]|uniref:Saposin B-type domain-containing protein n=1 Tax=Calicophoron daubneyi TaxID=300641 RepID=A0AAV2TCB0_CALDB